MNPSDVPHAPSAPAAPAGGHPAAAVPGGTKGRKTLLIVVAAVAVVLVASGVVTALLLRPDEAGPATATTALPTSTGGAQSTASSAPAAPKYTGTLLAVALPIPSGATRDPLRMGAADGRLDLDAVLAQYADADRSSMRELLTSMTFERGLFLAWTDVKKVSVYLQIYQFGSGTGANAWMAAEMRPVEAEAASSGSLNDIPGGRWFTTTTPNGRNAVHAVYCKGDLWVGVSTFTQGKGDVNTLTQLATDQYRLLP